MRKKHNDENLAQSAWEILNDLVGEIHAGRMLYFLALKGPSKGGIFSEIFSPEFKKYYLRLGFGAIAIALYKYDDLWNHQLKHLLGDQNLEPGRRLAKQIKDRKIREVRSVLFAHYSDNPRNPRKRQEEIEQLLDSLNIETDEQIINWPNDIIPDLVKIKKALKNKYGVGPHKMEK